MTFGAVMISCPDRDAVREQTLESLTESDWADAHVHVEMDKTQFERRQERQEHTALMALQQGQELDADYLLFLEDDLIFNRHLRFNLECWAPLRQKAVSLASLYNPGVRERERCAVESWLVADPDSIFGSQAFTL